jgi:hypothetical protein
MGASTVCHWNSFTFAFFFFFKEWTSRRTEEEENSYRTSQTMAAALF